MVGHAKILLVQEAFSVQMLKMLALVLIVIVQVPWYTATVIGHVRMLLVQELWKE